MSYNKYNARKITMGGYTFDSQAEARRWQQLCMLANAGDIISLEVHPVFVLLKDFVDADGKKIRRIKYEADFSYFQVTSYKDPEGLIRVVEDVKGAKTPEFKLKEKLMKWSIAKKIPGFERLKFVVIPSNEV